MLVYANEFKVIGSDAYQILTKSIHGWLQQIMDQHLPLADTLKDRTHSNENSDIRPWLNIRVNNAEQPSIYGWKLKHLDKSVSGRQWIIEIGLKIESDGVDFSCHVSTEELSTLVRTPIDASRPRLIQYIIDNLKKSKISRLASNTPGISKKYIGRDATEYKALRAEIEHPDRDYPLVIISPTKDGEYLIDSTYLQESLFGLAQVLEVIPGFDSYDMEEELGRQCSAWDGAINIIRQTQSSRTIRNKLILSNDIEELGDKNSHKISKILALITHNTNVPKSKKCIRFDYVVQEALRNRLEQKKLSSKTDIESLRNENTDLWNEIYKLEEEKNQLDSKIIEKENSINALEDELIDSREKNNKQIAKIESLNRRNASKNQSSNIAYLLDLAARPDQPTPEECLIAIETSYPERCEILESAKESARKSNLFRSGRRLLDMLRRLVTSFYENIQNGGDNAARNVFTKNEYSATESDSVIKSKELSQKRTYQRNGSTIEMYRHLKIGKSDNTSITLRVYFEWLPKERKIIIGHCGEHLPISSH